MSWLDDSPRRISDSQVATPNFTKATLNLPKNEDKIARSSHDLRHPPRQNSPQSDRGPAPVCSRSLRQTHWSRSFTELRTQLLGQRSTAKGHTGSACGHAHQRLDLGRLFRWTWLIDKKPTVLWNYPLSPNPILKSHKKLWANLIRPQSNVAKQRSPESIP
jgi:hypothetical protein